MADGSCVDLPARIIRRSAWGAAAASPAAQYDAMPWDRLWIHHTAGAAGEADAMRAVQRQHQQSNGWRDFAYTLGVSVTGQIFDGIGIGRRHLNSDAGCSGAIVCLGNFDTTEPPPAMLDALAWIAATGAASGWWKRPAFDGGHRDIPNASPTACPGRFLHARLADINNAAAALAVGDTDDQEVDEMPRWIARDSDVGSVWLFDGQRLDPVNDNRYRETLTFHGALTPKGAAWFDWAHDDIVNVLDHQPPPTWTSQGAPVDTAAQIHAAEPDELPELLVELLAPFADAIDSHPDAGRFDVGWQFIRAAAERALHDDDHDDDHDLAAG
jgi:hypothetical protein